MRRCLLLLGACLAAQGHDVITTSITWNRDIIRIVHAHCASCHHPGGTAFSLLTYAEGRPWAVAIKEEVLRGRMPPWGANKGYGDFRNDGGLSGEEVERIVSWTDGGVPEGEAKDLQEWKSAVDAAPVRHPAGELIASSDFILPKAFKLDGLWPKKVAAGANFKVRAELPDGTVVPLLWLYTYKPEFGHPFLLMTPLNLPAHTVIRGIPEGSTIALMPARRIAPSKSKN